MCLMVDFKFNTWNSFFKTCICVVLTSSTSFGLYCITLFLSFFGGGGGG